MDTENTLPFMAAERLIQFLDQLNEMNEDERKACIERVDSKAPGLLAELYNTLNEYMPD